MGSVKWRVIAVYKEAYKISCGDKVEITKVTGSFINNAVVRSDFPAVGDWVYLNDFGFIERIEPRRSQLSRKTAGRRYDEQVIATNIDITFIVASLNKEFNVNKIGRYIILAETNRIRPIILLTKLDLCESPEEYIEKLGFYYPNIEIRLISAFSGIGVEEVYDDMKEGICAVFVGASGVGKSTLVNKLVGADRMKTSDIRSKDDKGRHTTTHRELFELDNGAFVIDTPGIREIGLWINDDYFNEFQDIYLLGNACKYRNCKHINEAGCAVLRALRSGDLSHERYRSYIKMTREVYYSKLGQDMGERIRFKNKVKKMCKNERYNRH